MATQDNAWGSGDPNNQETTQSAFSRLNVNAPEFVPSFLPKPDPPTTNSNDNSSNVSPGIKFIENFKVVLNEFKALCVLTHQLIHIQAEKSARWM